MSVDESPEQIRRQIEALTVRSREIHESECLNLNPATNLMNPRAEALLCAGLGTRVSLGDPGDKYEMGLEAIEQIELITSGLARQVFGAAFAEIRVPSGAMANLFAFMATCSPGDSVIVPPASIGGHVTHHQPGAAGLYGLRIHEAPVDATNYSIDVAGLASLARAVKPKLITMGQSLNLGPHPVAEVAAIAAEVGAKVLFDAAHVCGLLAGGVWENPLEQGADIVSMSTYKSLGGPPGGLLVSNDSELAARLSAIAYPGLTANFDVSVSAALAITLADWLDDGPNRAKLMCANASALAEGLMGNGLNLFMTPSGPTSTHQFALLVGSGHVASGHVGSGHVGSGHVGSGHVGSGHRAAKHLRRANLLSSAIGLPGGGEAVRLGTPELTTIGMLPSDMSAVADLIAAAWNTAEESALLAVGNEASSLRQQFG